jgi:hypothetical protein
MPTVLLPAAEPLNEAAVAEPPELTTQPEYVYLSRVVTAPVVNPSAKMPVVLFPVAELLPEAAVAAPPALTTHPE